MDHEITCVTKKDSIAIEMTRALFCEGETPDLSTSSKRSTADLDCATAIGG